MRQAPVYTPEEFSDKVEEYFNTVKTEDQTRAGLFVFLGITKTTFYNYKNGLKGEELKEIAEWACTRLEHKYELELNHKGNPTGPIFALKQYGWRDSQEVEAKVSGFEIVCNVPRPEEK